MTGLSLADRIGSAYERPMRAPVQQAGAAGDQTMRQSSTLATFLALFLATSANAASLGLRAGDYGATGLACRDQPNATTMSFDGRNFSYPHASGCTDRVLMRSAGLLTIEETCRAAGDGSPARADTQTFRFRRLGPERFTLIKGTSATTFRRCGALGYFNRH